MFTLAHGFHDGSDLAEEPCERRLWQFDGPTACRLHEWPAMVTQGFVCFINFRKHRWPGRRVCLKAFCSLLGIGMNRLLGLVHGKIDMRRNIPGTECSRA